MTPLWIVTMTLMGLLLLPQPARAFNPLEVIFAPFIFISLAIFGGCGSFFSPGCGTHGRCVDGWFLGLGRDCLCDPGWTRRSLPLSWIIPNCYDCDPNDSPCGGDSAGGGNCERVTTEQGRQGYECVCPEGVAGTECETQCQPGWTGGEYCESCIIGSSNAFNPCGNGTCVAAPPTEGGIASPTGGGTAFCECDPGWGYSGGTSSSDTAGLSCNQRCAPGWTGFLCNSCLPEFAGVCGEQGTCQPNEFAFESFCECNSGYCTEFPDSNNDPSEPLSGGTCVPCAFP